MGGGVGRLAAAGGPDGRDWMKRRIVFLIGSMARGGAERVAATLVNAWAARGDSVTLVSTYLNDATVGYDLHPAVAVVHLAQLLGAPGIKSRWRYFLKLRALRRLIVDLSPNVVVSFLTNVNISAIVSMLGLRVPLIISERVHPIAGVELPVSLRVARRLLYQFANCLVVQTTEVAHRYQACLFRPPTLVVIPNPLPETLHTSSERASTDGREIVAMGRLTPQKRFDRLIEAFSLAFPRGSPWKLRLWGEGPLRETLQDLIDSMSLADRVQLAGVTSEPWRALLAGQMFVLSSDYEGFPNAMLEAMALGVACVAFDCPTGPRDLASGDTAALLVPPGEVGLLAEVLRTLAEDRERRRLLGNSAAELVRKQFSQAAVLARWDHLFETLAPAPT